MDVAAGVQAAVLYDGTVDFVVERVGFVGGCGDPDLIWWERIWEGE